MIKFYIAAGLALAILGTTGAYAADAQRPAKPLGEAGTKAEASAIFRLKVATCKADAKSAGVRTTTPDFYAYMGTCLDRVTVAVNIEPSK
jgi:hypothetical protein